MVATLRTRTLESRRMARGITGAARATSGERSTTASGVMAPMMSSPPGPTAMRACSWPSLRRLTSRVGRKTPAFIISMSAVPPAIGRTDVSSGSSSAMASRSELGSSSSNGVMVRALGCLREGCAQPLGELPFHLLGLGTQHRLAEAAELAGQRRVDLVAHLGSPVLVREPRGRASGEPPDDAERSAFDLGLDLARRIGPHHLDRDVELELEVRNLGLQHGGVMVCIDLVELLHALDAGGEEARIAHLREHLLARRINHDLAGELHRFGPRFLRAFKRIRNAIGQRGGLGGTGICRPPSILAHQVENVKSRKRDTRPAGAQPFWNNYRLYLGSANAERCYNTEKISGSSRNGSQGSALTARSKRIRRSESRKRESVAMWISLFTFAAAAAVCLSVAAIMMQSPERRTIRG